MIHVNCLMDRETLRRAVLYLKRIQFNQYQAGDPVDEELVALIEELDDAAENSV